MNVINQWFPGFVSNRTPQYWKKPMVVSALLYGLVNIFMSICYTNNHILILSNILIGITSINYWRNPEPGLRHKFDVLAIIFVCAFHMYLCLLYSSPYFVFAYIIPPSIVAFCSMLAINWLPSKYYNRDFSCGLWILLHLVLSYNNYKLYRIIQNSNTR